MNLFVFGTLLIDDIVMALLGTVPERVGAIEPEAIAAEAADWLASPERLQGQQEDLRSLRGQPGAVAALAAEVRSLLPKALAD